MSTASAPASKPLGSTDLRYQLNALGCPHPESRRRALIQVTNPQGEAMDLCASCKLMFDEFLSRWPANDVSPREIRARMLRRGYSAEDVRQFITDLEAAA